MSDKQIKDYWQPIKAPEGMFFCWACLRDLPLNKRSEKDMRYCNFCQPIIEKEYLMLSERKGRPLDNFYCPVTLSSIAIQSGRNMSTLKNPKIEVDIIQPSVAKVSRGKRGPKPRVLPNELIKQWAGEGMGSKAIATRLNAERDVKVSYKTIQRMLSGERIKLSLPISGA
jgi:hypothetical protein